MPVNQRQSNADYLVVVWLCWGQISTSVLWPMDGSDYWRSPAVHNECADAQELNDHE